MAAVPTTSSGQHLASLANGTQTPSHLCQEACPGLECHATMAVPLPSAREWLHQDTTSIPPGKYTWVYCL